MEKVAIIHGPNLNLLGTRETDIYGTQSFDDYLKELDDLYPELEITLSQSNIEGEIVTLIQDLSLTSDYLIVNAAAYAHTSIAIADAIAAIQTPVVGIHISNIYQREEERHVDLIAKNCEACLFGFGLNGYQMALDYISSQLNE